MGFTIVAVGDADEGEQSLASRPNGADHLPVDRHRR